MSNSILESLPKLPRGLNPLQSSCFMDVRIDGDTFTHSAKNENESTILFDLPISKGTARIEFVNVKHLFAVGIADDSVKYSREENPWVAGKQKIVCLDECGQFGHIGEMIKGNSWFNKEGDHVALELNMDAIPRTLTLFINDNEQNNYIANIPEMVRFWAFLFFKNSSFKITKFERNKRPTAKHGQFSVAWQWGQQWKQSDQEKIEQKKGCCTII
ncbi:MAG: hypothetical protein EZS28_019795 [Streblomastix strix]|uniref:Uncharacterized protein n=1 Tax=Streblomastix strix TaxID=222440 RepID=A0A5J4VQQ3_9EUKA|nr:MAG: hypothetical protein EZS28_019795 [Streblomastix strix]